MTAAQFQSLAIRVTRLEALVRVLNRLLAGRTAQDIAEAERELERLLAGKEKR